MKIPSPSTLHRGDESAPPIRWRRMTLLVLVGFALSFIVTQMILFEPQNQAVAARVLVSTRNAFCDQGVRMPFLPCTTGKMVQPNIEADQLSLAEQFSRLPDLGAVMEKLTWEGRTEADAAKLLSVVQAAIIARKHESNKNYEANGAVSHLLTPVWKQYPQLVVAASCLYCSRNFGVLENLMGIEPNPFEELLAVGANQPRLLAAMTQHHSVDASFIDEVIALQAEFIFPGDATTAEFIGRALADKNDVEGLRIWVSKGLNGGRAIQGQDLNALPMEVVIAAWQRGVRLGYDQVELSEFLVSRGYRPALRWVVWLQGGGLKYLQSWGYQRVQGRYEAIMANHTDFPALSGPALAKHYSQFWQQVRWNDATKRWETLGK